MSGQELTCWVLHELDGKAVKLYGPYPEWWRQDVLKAGGISPPVHGSYRLASPLELLAWQATL